MDLEAASMDSSATRKEKMGFEKNMAMMKHEIKEVKLLIVLQHQDMSLDFDKKIKQILLSLLFCQYVRNKYNDFLQVKNKYIYIY